MPLRAVVPELVSDINLKRARTEDDQGNTCIRVKGETSTDLTPITDTLGEKDDATYSGSGDGTVVTLLKGIYDVFGNTPTPSWEPQCTPYAFQNNFILDGPGENIPISYTFGKFVLNAEIGLTNVAFSGTINMSFTMPFDTAHPSYYPSVVTKTETFVDWKSSQRQSITVTVSFIYFISSTYLTINGNYDYSGVTIDDGMNTLLWSPNMAGMQINTISFPSFIYNYQ